MTGAGKDQVTEMVIEMAAMGSVLEQAHLKIDQNPVLGPRGIVHDGKNNDGSSNGELVVIMEVAMAA